MYYYFLFTYVSMFDRFQESRLCSFRVRDLDDYNVVDYDMRLVIYTFQKMKFDGKSLIS